MLGRTETRIRDRMYCQTIRTVRDISRDDRARIATCSLRTPTDKLIYMKTSMQSTNKPRPPVPSSMDVCDLGGGSGPPRLHTGGAKNLWVKKNHHTRGERLKIATYNVRTLLKDEHVQELEEELKENNMKWDVIGLGEVRRKEESFTTLQIGHLRCHSEANNGQAGVGFLINKKWKDNITRVSSGNSRVAELVLRITDIYQLKIVQVYAPTTSHSDEETDNFYNTIDKILESKPITQL